MFSPSNFHFLGLQIVVSYCIIHLIHFSTNPRKDPNWVLKLQSVEFALPGVGLWKVPE